MNVIDVARAQVDAADGIGPTFGAACDAFELTRVVARRFKQQRTDEWVMWSYAIPPACDGRDVLGFAPSTPEGLILTVRPSDLNGLTEDQAADGLAELVSAITTKLRIVRPLAAIPKDAAAIESAIRAADEIQRLLSP